MQKETFDCGAACLKMIAKFYGKDISLKYLIDICSIGKMGTTLRSLSNAAEAISFRTTGVSLNFEGNEEEAGIYDVPLPVIAYWEQRHFIVVYKVDKKSIWVADPAIGLLRYDHEKFKRGWYLGNKKGVLLLLEPTHRFFTGENMKEIPTGSSRWENISHIFNYLRPYKKLIGQLTMGICLSSIFSLILPFLTKSVVDQGISNQDIGLIYLILLGQLTIFLSQTIIEILQSWITLHIGNRVGIALLFDFLDKLMKLPIAFFSRNTDGYLLQRINELDRINSLFTNSSFTTIFSLFNLIIFSVVLLIYSAPIFIIFWFLSIIHVSWILVFLKKRKTLDVKRLELFGRNKAKLLEIIQGITEIKLQNSEKKRRWQWINIQAKIFKANIKFLRLTQFQYTGGLFFLQLKNILISFFAAKSVVEGNLTLGMMLSIQYIIGQISYPLESLVNFIQSIHDAKISMERLNEIHDYENEESHFTNQISEIPASGDISFTDTYFRYSENLDYVLKGISLKIPRNKVTAIVGGSGSGKTTLIKLLLGFYPPSRGEIRLGEIPLNHYNLTQWRRSCGAVMQESFIFPDTIANNITESSDEVDAEMMIRASKTANIHHFISNLKAGYNTILGEHGVDLSRGQKQRILIARAVYKNPHFLFFDEATNALDAENEAQIMQNLTNFYAGRTVVVVAHRLSTVINADQIVLFDNGQIVEQGTHISLLEQDGYYANLISKQLGFQKV